jgi:hypothetical protein
MLGTPLANTAQFSPDGRLVCTRRMALTGASLWFVRTPATQARCSQVAATTWQSGGRREDSWYFKAIGWARTTFG